MLLSCLVLGVVMSLQMLYAGPGVGEEWAPPAVALHDWVGRTVDKINDNAEATLSIIRFQAAARIPKEYLALAKAASETVQLSIKQIHISLNPLPPRPRNFGLLPPPILAPKLADYTSAVPSAVSELTNGDSPSTTFKPQALSLTQASLISVPPPPMLSVAGPSNLVDPSLAVQNAPPLPAPTAELMGERPPVVQTRPLSSPLLSCSASLDGNPSNPSGGRRRVLTVPAQILVF
ncbi:hypothetical protein FB451DRAFT_1561007 [Mycena latifolia]|nr:hypothetical protein FB451DRAFT_1561007 [Mycena latifolia]